MSFLSLRKLAHPWPRAPWTSPLPKFLLQPKCPRSELPRDSWPPPGAPQCPPKPKPLVSPQLSPVPQQHHLPEGPGGFKLPSPSLGSATLSSKKSLTGTSERHQLRINSIESKPLGVLSRHRPSAGRRVRPARAVPDDGGASRRTPSTWPGVQDAHSDGHRWFFKFCLFVFLN